MKGKLLTAAAYPPPPPPPPPEAAPKMDSRKLLVVALLIVIIVVSAGVLFYLASGPSSTNPSPSPSATPTATSTATPTSSPTFTPTPSATSSGTNPIANFRVGAYATYRMTTITSTESTISTLKMSVDGEETYNEIPCWLLSMTTETPTEGGTSKVVITWWMSKTGLEVIHIRMQMYVNNVLTYDQEYDPDETSTDTGEPPEPVDPQTILSYETVTVPAGTFANCAKAESGSATSKVDVWVHQDVPIWGIVKSETYSNSELQTKMELTDYRS
jgi:flagellar basal body-associated protein FliL